MNQDKSTMGSWVAWVAVIIGVIALIMAWVAMNNVNTLREEVETNQQVPAETEIAPPPMEEPMNGTDGGAMNGGETPDATAPEENDSVEPLQ